MNHAIPDLQIRIHKLDGSVSTFVQDDVQIAKQILDTFDPMQAFSRQNIVLADNQSHTSFPASQITRIDLDSKEHSHLIFESGLVEAVELSKDEFEALIQNLAIRDQWTRLGEEDAFVVAFLNAEMADGQCVLLTMEVDAKSPQGLSELREFLMNRPGLCFRMRNGGVAVLNLANLARLTFFPGTVQPPPDAWHVRLIGTTSPGDPESHPVVQRPANPSLSPHKLSIAKEYKWEAK
jgi:hypothetical protein